MSRDPFDRLRDADPLRGRPGPDADSAQARAMRDAILADPATDVSSHRRRRRRVAAAVAIAAAATAAALAVSTSRVSDPTSVGCYDGPATDASTLVVGTRGDNPVAQCRELWERGEVDPQVTTPDEVPELVACVVESGVVGVFPAPSCDDVRTAGSAGTEDPADDPTAGLDAPDHHTDDQTVVAALEEVRQGLFEQCMRIDDATTYVEQTLSEHGLEGWRVAPVVEGPYGDHCAGFFPQAQDQAVLLVPDDPRTHVSSDG